MRSMNSAIWFLAALLAGVAVHAQDDPQSALKLDPKVISKGIATDGSSGGQTKSLTSTNNFINFCLTRPDLPITNGQQVKSGSCNPAPMGALAPADKLPSSKFTAPKHMDIIPANTKFTVKMTLANIQAGNFVNAKANYYSAPQQLNAQGVIIGHSHVVIEKLDPNDENPTEPNVFAFFKGINAPAVNNEVTVDLDDGLPAGTYRLSSINAAANHQPVLASTTNHGFLDDIVYFTAQ